MQYCVVVFDLTIPVKKMTELEETDYIAGKTVIARASEEFKC